MSSSRLNDKDELIYLMLEKALEMCLEESAVDVLLEFTAAPWASCCWSLPP